MGISRKISLIVLFAVSLVLIMHAVLPHHHHQDDVCFTDSHCNETSRHDDTGCTDDEDHEHDGQDAASKCTLHSTFLLPYSMGQISKQEIQKILKQHILYVLDSEDVDIQKNQLINTHGLAFTDDIVSRLIIPSLGLRGPPCLA